MARPHDATLLAATATVLVTGPNSAQLYDPASGTWTATGKMIGNGYFNTFTVLRDGRVLAVSGRQPAAVRPRQRDLDRDWEDEHTASTAPPPRSCPTAGCSWPAATVPPRRLPTNAAEVYDPVTGSWTEIADMQAGGRTRSGWRRSCPMARCWCTHEWDRRSTTRPPEPGPHVLGRPSSAARSQRHCCRMAPC